MAKNTGTLVIAQVKKYDDQDTYPVVAAEDCSVVEQNGVTGTDVQTALENLAASGIPITTISTFPHTFTAADNGKTFELDTAASTDAVSFNGDSYWVTLIARTGDGFTIDQSLVSGKLNGVVGGTKVLTGDTPFPTVLVHVEADTAVASIVASNIPSAVVSTPTTISVFPHTFTELDNGKTFYLETVVETDAVAFSGQAYTVTLIDSPNSGNGFTIDQSLVPTASLDGVVGASKVFSNLNPMGIVTVAVSADNNNAYIYASTKGTITSLTYAQLLDLIAENAGQGVLIPGQKYQITDQGDKWVEGVTTSTYRDYPPTAQPVTYSELATLIADSNLVVGRKYTITDFKPKYGVVGNGDAVESSTVTDYDNHSSNGIDIAETPIGLYRGNLITISNSTNGTWDGNYVVDDIYDYGNGSFCLVCPDITWDADITGATVAWDNVDCGTVEPLTVTAGTINELQPEATSDLYPNDILLYEFVDSTGNGDKGRIYRRHDTVNNIAVNEDWRAIKYQRWETTAPSEDDFSHVGGGLDDLTYGGYLTYPGDRAFQIYIDTIGTPDTFKWSIDAINWSDSVPITGGYQTLQNNIHVKFANTTGHSGTEEWTISLLTGKFLCFDSGIAPDITRYLYMYAFENSPTPSTTKNVVVSSSSRIDSFWNCTFGINCSNNYFNGQVDTNACGNSFYQNTFGPFRENVIDNTFSGNVISGDFLGNTIGANCIYNFFGFFTEDNTIGNDFINNFIYGEFLTSSIADEFQQNKLHGMGWTHITTTAPVKHLNLDSGSWQVISGGGLPYTLSSADLLGATLCHGLSTIKATMDTNASADMTLIAHAGIITLICENGGISATQFDNFNANHPVTFKAQDGYSFTFTGTPFESISDDGQFLWQGDVVINSLYGDFIELTPVSITNTNGTFTVLKIKSRSIYE